MNTTSEMRHYVKLCMPHSGSADKGIAFCYQPIQTALAVLWW